MLKKLLNPRVLITFGLVSIVVSALLTAIFLGAIPDREEYERRGRAATAETLAATLMLNVASGRNDETQALLDFVQKRNPELISIGLRSSNQELISQAGQHEQLWQARNGEKSTDTQLIVPLAGQGGKWGQVELHFKPIAANNVLSWQANEKIQLIAIVALLCSVAFFVYLGAMLKQLDPSRAVPERVKSALDTLQEGLLLLDDRGQIVLANQSFAALLNRPQSQLVGAKADSLPWLESGSDPALRPWQTALQTGQTQLKVPMQMSHGQKTKSFLVNCAPVMGANGKPGGVLVSLADITELQEKEMQLLESKAQADSANRAKSDFLANMSHEIRTPMNAVLGFTDLLRRGAFSDQTQANQYLGIIHSSGKHLLALINDILDLSKVEAGKLEVERLPTKVHQVIADSVAALQVRAAEKHLQLNFSLDGKVPETVDTDPGRLRQIVTNLVGNALKFTENGSVSIVQRWIAATGQMQIDVIDTGIGIPQDKLQSIFKPFEQAESSTTRRFGGTGLGLSISQKFAQALGGDIVVTSQIGKGSCFRVSLKIFQPSESLIDELPDPELVNNNKGAKTWRFQTKPILVVDDSPENRALVKAVLLQSGLQIDEAENGEIAVQMVKRRASDHRLEPYSLILMDMQMPVMDGFTATRQLRQEGVKTPIIAFTAHALQGFEADIVAAGCDGYLTKPVDIDLLLNKIAQYIPLASLDGLGPAGTALEAKQPAPIIPIEPVHDQQDVLVSRLATIPALVPVIDIFLDRIPNQLAKLESAAQQQNWQAVAELAHWLKGSAGSVGFDAFTEPSKRLELAAKANDKDQVNQYLGQIRALTKRLPPVSGKQTLAATVQ